MLVSKKMAARLMGCSEGHLQKLQRNPQSGLDRHFRHHADISKIVDQRSTSNLFFDVHDLARFLLRRQRTSDFDLKPSKEPADAAVDALAQRLTLHAALITKADQSLDAVVQSMLSSALSTIDPEASHVDL